MYPYKLNKGTDRQPGKNTENISNDMFGSSLLNAKTVHSVEIRMNLRMVIIWNRIFKGTYST